jgi:hypothetical protein
MSLHPAKQFKLYLGTIVLLYINSIYTCDAILFHNRIKRVF